MDFGDCLFFRDCFSSEDVVALDNDGVYQKACFRLCYRTRSNDLVKVLLTVDRPRKEFDLRF